MPGTNEIIIILIVVALIFLLPRLTGKSAPSVSHRAVASVASGPVRLFIALSLAWLAGVAIYLEPWNGRWPGFIYLAILPVAVFWTGAWVFSGFRGGSAR